MIDVFPALLKPVNITLNCVIFLTSRKVGFLKIISRIRFNYCYEEIACRV